MPIPSPSESELRNNDQQGFVSRCIAQLTRDGEGESQEQRAAICYAKWREHKQSSKLFDPDAT